MNQTSIETDNRAAALTSSAIMRRLFIALFAQLQLILFASLASSKAPLFVSKIRLQVDFEDFYIATADWLHGLDPYARLDQFLYHRLTSPRPCCYWRFRFSASPSTPLPTSFTQRIVSQ